MQQSEYNFELDCLGTKLNVQQHSISGQVIFRIQFADKRPPLVIHRALNAEGKKFWTSIPEGRMPEAEIIGKFIVAHYQQKK